MLLLCKQAHDKRGLAESLHAQIPRARLTACDGLEVGYEVGCEVVASSSGPAQKSGKGPSVTCKDSQMCCVSSLCLE